MSRKLISVIIPTFNRAKLLVKAIQSVKAQSYPNIQIIVADDGSQDNTAEIVAQFEDVEYYYQENKGQGAARNLGFKFAKGEYIASLDSDDIWFDNFLETAASALEHYKVDFVFLNWTEFTDTEHSISDMEQDGIWQKYSENQDGEWALLDDKEVRELFINSCPAPTSALLMKHSSIASGWNEEMKIADDWFLILEMVLRKPCRAAFTLTPYWKKYTHVDNIYHGRDPLEVLAEFGLHDEPLFAQYFREHLTSAEKAIFRRRLAVNHLNFVRLKLKRHGLSSVVLQSSLKTLRFLTSAFTLAPVSSIFYVGQLFTDHLKNRARIARNKRQQVQGTDGVEISKSLDTILKSKADKKF
ncbi:MAG: glycosyltransferase family 2 protein [Acidobacteriota bacterium]|nr:glycosyltransferase family 2 protein [Acidobacteriota bacterium]